jgi:hypothetical protein
MNFSTATALSRFDRAMSSAAPARPPATLDLALGAMALLAYAGGLPLGLDRIGAAPVVGAGYTLGAAAADGPAVAPLALLLGRLFSWLPLGDLATRANLASAAAAAVAAVLLGRVASEVLADLRPPANARRTERDLWHERVAAGACAGVAALALGVFLAVTTAGGVAVTLALAAGVWLQVLRVARAPDSTGDGLWLALLAGLAVGADPVALLLLWPPALLLWLWALRRGERWPLLGPLLATAGAAVALYPVAAAGVPISVRALAEGVVGAVWGGGAHDLGAAALWAAAAEACAELGVVASLAGAVGLFVLAVRAPFSCALVVASAGSCLLLSAGEAAAGHRIEHAAAPWALLLAIAAVPVGAGIAQMASKLGPARTASAAVIAVVALAWPALDGGARRWRRDARMPEGLLEQALARLGPAAEADPGSAEMRSLIEYGRALGVRPDVRLSPRP